MIVCTTCISVVGDLMVDRCVEVAVMLLLGSVPDSATFYVWWWAELWSSGCPNALNSSAAVVRSGESGRVFDETVVVSVVSVLTLGCTNCAGGGDGLSAAADHVYMLDVSEKVSDMSCVYMLGCSARAPGRGGEWDVVKCLVTGVTVEWSVDDAAAIDDNLCGEDGDVTAVVTSLGT